MSVSEYRRRYKADLNARSQKYATHKGKPWTEEEINWIVLNPMGLTDEELGRQLGRTQESVHLKRSRVKRGTNK